METTLARHQTNGGRKPLRRAGGSGLRQAGHALDHAGGNFVLKLVTFKPWRNHAWDMVKLGQNSKLVMFQKSDDFHITPPLFSLIFTKRDIS